MYVRLACDGAEGKEIALEMTAIPKSSRVNGTYGTGKTNGTTCFNVPVAVQDGQITVRGKPLAAGAPFFAFKSETPRKVWGRNPIFTFIRYESGAPHAAKANA